jgi:lipopolysaccharide/colanic/teichoic acid biosynthesis glycosyltransferase
MKVFYKPKLNSILVDVMLLGFNFLIIYGWFPLTTPVPFQKYFVPSLLFTVTWLIFSYFFQRYIPLRKQNFNHAIIKLLVVGTLQFILYVAILHNSFKEYSGYVILAVTIGIFCIEFLFLFFYFSYRFATRFDISISQYKERPQVTFRDVGQLDKESYNKLLQHIQQYSGKNVLQFLKQNFDLTKDDIRVLVNSDLENLELIPHYLFSTFIYLKKLNNTEKINSFFTIINEKLPDRGNFVCCFETKSTRKKRILKKYPPVINYLIYSFDYLFNRFIPKVFVSRRIYHSLNSGKNRVLSKAEVLGRLYCHGFEVIKEKKIDGILYIWSQRTRNTPLIYNRAYGPLIKLKRYGKNGKVIYVYKFRTMHPYSEYLQDYVYQHHSLQAGGKFNKDFRVTTIGKFMRKHFLDELPMLINIFKGEMKLIGIRPLSRQYLNLYNDNIQQLRKKYRPGLLPPFYADMPRTLDEIQESEKKYLLACEKNGVLLTDIKYFFLILKNILFHHARSA